MFKKLVDKASLKKPGELSDGLKSSDVGPHLVFHYGIPSGSTKFAYDSIQKILAIATKDGRIKLLGRDNTQALLESNEVVPSKFLQFVENQGILLNVTSKDQIEVWDIDKKQLSHVHLFKAEVTSFAIIKHSLYMFIGDSVGNVSVLKLDQESALIVDMKYTIPCTISRGTPTEFSADSAVTHILPQPTAESKRVLIIFRDGLISLWKIRESKSIFTTGGNMIQSQHQEPKKVTSACWACPFGSKVALGYSNGEILIWSIPPTLSPMADLTECSTPTAPICKLNLGYRLDKIPIASLIWGYADGKTSRLYVMGAPDFASVNLLQIVLLNEQTETRTIKLGLPLPEPCVDMEIIVSSSDQNKHKQDSFLLLGKSGHIYAYDDCLIEKYLLQSQSRSPPSLPKELGVEMPVSDSRITVANFITNSKYMMCSADENYLRLTKSIPPLLPFEAKLKDGAHSSLNNFSGFSKVKNLYITGHCDGAINFWDLSCPILLPVLSLKQQSEDDFSLSGIAVTSLYFDGNTRFLISGDQSGIVRIFKFKPEPYVTKSSFMGLQGSSRKGNNHIIQGLKLIKVNGSVLCLNIRPSSGHLAVGTDKGYVSVIDVEGPTQLYEKHIATELCTGVVSLQFDTCSVHGFEKNVLVVATKDSSCLSLDSDTGSTLTTVIIRPKKPSLALFARVLDLNKENPAESMNSKQASLLLCSEKAVYLYLLTHVIQGIKKVLYKKKFQSSSCCWASTFYSHSEVGLILLFTSGKIEIRSLPELSLINETTIRGFTNSTSNTVSLSESSVCCSSDGELVMVKGDQEMLVVSVSLQREVFRLLDSISQVYTKDLIHSRDMSISVPTAHKEKKKGIFSSVMKEIKGSKAKPVVDVETEDPNESIKELTQIFSTANFLGNAEENSRPMDTDDDDDNDLDIDDIDIEDPGEKPKEQNMLASLNTQKLANKFQAFKGKLKQMKTKNEKGCSKEVEQDEKVGSVDQIKRKYGFPSSSETNDAKMAESKLQDNVRKLQGINLRSTEMEDTAKSFSCMAQEVLRTAEQDRQKS